MKLFMKSLPIYLLPLIGLLFYSCIDAPVAPNGNMISGTVYDKYGKYEIERFNPLMVSPGNAPITELGNTPEFSINSLNKPYDLVINEYFSSLIVKFEGINTNTLNPVFYHPIYSTFTNWGRNRYIFVEFPPVSSSKKIFIKLISDDNFIQYNNVFYIDEGTSFQEISIVMPDDYYYPSGDIILLEADEDINGNLNFEKFGIKHINGYQYCTFNDSDLAYDPPETLSHFTNVRPHNTNIADNRVLISFPGKFISSDLVLYNSLDDVSDITIPQLPFNNYKIKFTGTYKTNYPYDIAFKNVLLDPGNDCEIIHKEPVQLSEPPDEEINVNGLTEFKISDDNTTGIFIIDLILFYENNYENKILRYFTTKKSFKFSDLTVRGFEFSPNSKYKWCAYKLPEYQNIDELLSTPYFTDNRYNSIQISGMRTFYTGP